MLDATPLDRALPLPASPRAVVLIVHPDAHSARLAGHAFVADVLRANGFANLPMCLHKPQEQAAGVPPPGLVQSKLRVRAMLDTLATQPSLRALPVALIGLGNAVPGCAAAAARLKLPRLRSLVLLDGRAEQVPHHLVHLNVPTLFVLGQADAQRLALHRAATRDMAARHRTEVLRHRTEPRPASGALEAFACLAVAWLDDSLNAPHPLVGEAGLDTTAPSGLDSAA